MTNDEIVIDIKGLVVELFRKLPIIVIVGLITAVLGYSYANYYLVPTYQSNTKVYILTNVNETGTGTYVTDLQIGTLITEDCANLIQSRYVGEQVVKELDLDMTYGEVLSKVKVDTTETSRIVGITVTDTDPTRAMDIANCVREVSSKHIREIMGIEAVNTVEKANKPINSSGPNVGKYTMLGAIAGLFIMCAVFALRFILNDTIRVPEDIETKLGISVLAVVPVNKNGKKQPKKRD